MDILHNESPVEMLHSRQYISRRIEVIAYWWDNIRINRRHAFDRPGGFNVSTGYYQALSRSNWPVPVK